LIPPNASIPWVELGVQHIEVALFKLFQKEKVIMRKRLLTCVVVVALMAFLAAPALAEDNYLSNKVGVGYQGMMADDYLNGISVRGWINDNIGLEGSLFYGGMGIEADSFEVADADLMLFEAKAMYAFIVKSNSRFYAGAKFGYGMINLDAYEETLLDDSLWSLGTFIGAEWNWSEIPELGFNFDVGYNYINYEEDFDGGHELEISLDGIAATFGIHYYF